MLQAVAARLQLGSLPQLQLALQQLQLGLPQLQLALQQVIYIVVCIHITYLLDYPGGRCGGCRVLQAGRRRCCYLVCLYVYRYICIDLCESIHIDSSTSLSPLTLLSGMSACLLPVIYVCLYTKYTVCLYTIVLQACRS